MHQCLCTAQIGNEHAVTQLCQVAAVALVARFEISMFENLNDQQLAAVGLQQNWQLVKLHLLTENSVQIG